MINHGQIAITNSDQYHEYKWSKSYFENAINQKNKNDDNLLY